MPLTSLEAIAEKLQENRQNQLEDILRVSGSNAMAKDVYGITTVDESNVATSLVFKSLNKPKLNINELIKAIDVNVTELKPDIPESVKDLIPKPLYDEQVTLNADLTSQVENLNAKVETLNTQINDLKAQIETEVNNRLNIEQSNDGLTNQLSSLSKTVEDFSKQIQSSVQKSVDESVLRASLQAQNVGLKAQVEALIKQIDSLNSIIEGLQAQIGAVQQQQAIQSSTKNLAFASGGDVVNEVAVITFDPPWAQDSVKIVGRFKSGGGCRWERGSSISITNNDTADIKVKLSVPGWPAGRDFFSIPTTEFDVKPTENKKITFGLNEGAVGDLESRPKRGPFGGHKGSQTYTGGKFVVAVTRTTDNTTKDITYDTAFHKLHPNSY
jgi:phosphate uptake regulator